MKFLKDNWYKLMTGTAMLIFACGFFIYAVGPSYANQTSEVNKPQMEGVEDYVAVVSDGYIYTWEWREHMMRWTWGIDKHEELDIDYSPKKRKLP